MILATAVLVGGVGAGCGGDDDGGSGGDLSTGLAKSKLLSDVTEAEAQSACENIGEGFEAKLSRDKVLSSFCTLFAALQTQTKAECETARDTCIDEAESGNGVVAEASADVGPPSCENSESLLECGGTVGQLETCANDLVDQIADLLDSFSCDDAGTIDPEDTEAMADIQPPASCAEVDCGEDGPFPSGDEE